MKSFILPVTVALAVTIVQPAWSAESGLHAELACEPTTERLAYVCTIHMTEQDAAVEDLAIQVKADMPSMPMAHNIPPVRAQATDEPGVYEFPITLDMYGRWAFSMTVMGARQDMLVEALDFEAPEGEEDDHHHHHHDDHDHDSDAAEAH